MHLILSRPTSFWPPASTEPHPIYVEQATNQLVAALHNYHAIVSGLSESFVSYAWELPQSERAFLKQRVSIAERAIWEGGE